MKRAFLLAPLLLIGVAAPAWAAGHGDHWSVLQYLLPQTLAHNLQGLLGPVTFVEGEAPSKVAHVVFAGLVALVLLLLGLAANRRLSGKNREEAIAPGPQFTALTFFEMVVDAALSTMAGMMGEKNARRYFPIVGGLAFFILLSNLLVSIPGFLPPTDNWNTTLALGLVVFLAYNYYGVKEHGLGYLKHFFGPIQKWYALPLMLFMFVIELIGHVVRPFSLSIRLMGNIFGDHMVLAIFLGFHMIFVPIPIQVLGLLVAVVQTFVFCLLSTAYIAMAVADEEH